MPRNTCDSWTTLTILRNGADMKAQRAHKISLVLRSLGTELEDRLRKAEESDIAEATSEVEGTNEGPLRDIPKSYGDFLQRVKHLDEHFQRHIGYCSREIRNRHFLERNLVELPSNEAREAITTDPGLRIIRSWDIADDRVFLLVRYDAGCAFCGKPFELNVHGEPVSERDLSNPSAELQVLESMLGAGPSWRNDAPEQPHAPVSCPHCGWASALDNKIKSIELEYDETGIRTVPHPVVLGGSWMDYCWYGETMVEPIGFEIDWERGKITYAGEDVTYSGLPDAAMFHLAQFPIVPAALEALDAFNPDIFNSLPKPIENLESLIAAVRN